MAIPAFPAHQLVITAPLFGAHQGDPGLPAVLVKDALIPRPASARCQWFDTSGCSSSKLLARRVSVRDEMELTSMLTNSCVTEDNDT